MEINKTSTQKLDNNVQVAQTTTTKPAVKTAEGTSFKDAVSMMSDIDVANNVKTDVKPANTENADKTATSTKDFKFVSTTESKTTFDKTLNKENLTQNQKLSIHQKAEKELVKEIVLVNNKQVELKANKNENQIAQVSTAIKSDKEIETEKNDKSKLNREHSNDSDLLDLSSNNRNQQSNLNDNAEVSSDVDTVEISNNSDNLKMADDLVIDKTTKNDIPVDFDIVNTVPTTQNKDITDSVAEKNNDVEVVGSIANAETKSLDIVKDEVVTNVTKNNNKANLPQNDVKNDTTQIKTDVKAEVKNVETKDVKPAITDEIEFVANDKFAKNTSSLEKANAVSNNIKSLLKDEKVSKTEKSDNKKSVISNSKVDNDTTIIKNTVATEVGEINPVDLNKTEKPAQDMKVITFAPISPVQDLKENLTTSKTSDIVKFIDANLETTSTKKASKSSSTSAKKSEEKAIKMTEADAKFFQNLVENNNQVAQDSKATDMANQTTLKDVEETHSAKVSKSLLNALKESQETNKSFRVDFDKDLSVILKVNRDGKISAEFLPGDAAVEQYLKSNIPLLKQKFNDEGLEYENLSYRDQSRKDKEEKRNNRNNKENGYE